ncbi:hypothetical protein BCU96_12995 [Vibrio lentus]|uniref:hypothetical protein n=1 Tax=Vibrio lentus TaxID=136468 RepID=UPI000C83416A|nr:hypothetical protein [Vibrio lentus]PMG18174.1 hypothetical protein BCU96_12995 [Vibrio lentus]PMN12673.1 hypothetical protein BCT39_24225 [Vibrio lentus]
MLSFEKRKELLEQALEAIHAEELFRELCAEEATGPTVAQFFCKTPTYVMLPKSCLEQKFDSLKSIKVTNSSFPSMKSVFREACNEDYTAYAA